jgi:hypothetical protein
MWVAFCSKINENKTWKLIVSAATTVDQFLSRDKERNQTPQEVEITRFSFILSVIRSPIMLLYYFYLWLPLFWFTLFFKYLELIVRVSTRRSQRVKSLMRHILAFYNSGLTTLSFYPHHKDIPYSSKSLSSHSQESPNRYCELASANMLRGRSNLS